MKEYSIVLFCIGNDDKPTADEILGQRPISYQYHKELQQPQRNKICFDIKSIDDNDLQTYTLKENFENVYTTEKEIANSIYVSVKKNDCTKYIVKYSKTLNFVETAMIRQLPSNERVSRFIDAYKDPNGFAIVYTHMIPIIDYVTIRNKYSEELVVCILRQLLDAVQWLHLNNIVHLNLNPLSIFNSDLQNVNLKLIGFENAIELSGNNKTASSVSLNIEFTGKLFFQYIRRTMTIDDLNIILISAPEVLENENISFASDIWSIGVLTSLM